MNLNTTAITSSTIIISMIICIMSMIITSGTITNVCISIAAININLLVDELLDLVVAIDVHIDMSYHSVYIYIYMFIYMQRERERERERFDLVVAGLGGVLNRAEAQGGAARRALLDRPAAEVRREHDEGVREGDGAALGVLGWHQLSNAACLMRPHLSSTALLV